VDGGHETILGESGAKEEVIALGLLDVFCRESIMGVLARRGVRAGCEGYQAILN
jgi:hypothetical protein